MSKHSTPVKTLTAPRHAPGLASPVLAKKPMRINLSKEKWVAHFNVPNAMIPGHIIKLRKYPHRPVASIWVGGGLHGKERQQAVAQFIAKTPEMAAMLKRVCKELKGDPHRSELIVACAKLLGQALRKVRR